MTAPRTNLTPADTIAACQSLLRGDVGGVDEASDGPDEQVVGAADDARLAERAERVEQRWREWNG